MDLIDTCLHIGISSKRKRNAELVLESLEILRQIIFVKLTLVFDPIVYLAKYYFPASCMRTNIKTQYFNSLMRTSFLTKIRELCLIFKAFVWCSFSLLCNNELYNHKIIWLPKIAILKYFCKYETEKMLLLGLTVWFWGFFKLLASSYCKCYYSH